MLKGISQLFKRDHREFEVFQIEVSSYSSLECKICPSAVFAEKWVFQNMSLETYGKIVPYFPRVRWVIFQGWGDALENESFPSMLQEAHLVGCSIALTTNGFFLTDALSKQLVDENLEFILINLEEIPRMEPGGLGTSTDLNRILGQVEGLVRFKKDRKRNQPKVKLSFLMTRLNMSVLPQVIPLAAKLGADEVVLKNLDYLPEDRWNILRTFYHESPTAAFEETLTEIHRLGKEMKICVRAYPLKVEEAPVCEANPPRNVFFSVDGSVGPCMYLRLPKKGEIPRIFLNKEYSVPQTFFGNIREEEFPSIWKKEDYIAFRKVFEDRIKARRNMGSIFDAVSNRSSSPQEIIESPPLSEVCRTCYKAYGI